MGFSSTESAPLLSGSKTFLSTIGADTAKQSSPLTQERGKVTELQLALNIIACCLGTGIFSLPWSAAGASFVPAVVIVAGVLALNAFALMVLVEAGERHQIFNLGGLLGHLPERVGRPAQFACNAIVWFGTYLCLVGYIVVVADCVVTSFPPLATTDYARATVVVMASTVALPLCFLELRYLSVSSTVAVAANLFIFAFVWAQCLRHEVDGTLPKACFFGISTGCIAMMSAMMNTVTMQTLVLPMYAEMKDRSPANFRRVLAASFSVLFALFSGFSGVGYLAFGSGVSSNVLLNLPSTALGHTARLCAALAVLAIYPLILLPMIAPLRSARALVLDRYSPQTVANIATCAVVIAVMVTAFFVHDLGSINVLNGAIAMGAFIAVAPSLVGLYLLGPTSVETVWRAKMYLLAFIGFAFSFLGVRFTGNYAAQLDAACVYSFAS